MGDESAVATKINPPSRSVREGGAVFVAVAKSLKKLRPKASDQGPGVSDREAGAALFSRESDDISACEAVALPPVDHAFVFQGVESPV
jgi:hypothetical protein